MAKLKIETGKGNKVLRTRSSEVSDFGKDLVDLVKGMKKVMKEQKGLGLAAPQVGKNVRVVLGRMNAGTDSEVLFVMVNPEILEKSSEILVAEEGCLSLPEYFVEVERARDIIVKFTAGIDPRVPVTLKLSGLNARVVQHEVDHLDGVLICDKASS